MGELEVSRTSEKQLDFSTILRTKEADEGHIRDKCGIFGVWGAPRASELAYFASYIQQHRGENGAGIVTLDSDGFHYKNGKGLVNEIFYEEDLKALRGKAAIAHVRYPTVGPAINENLQPFVRYTLNGPIAIAHNGQFANHEVIRRDLERNGAVFVTTSDTEIAVHTYAQSKKTEVEERIAETFAKLQPAYSIVILTKNELIGIRDPCGVRPLVLGELGNNTFALASETVAFDAIGAKYVGEVNPGEVVVIDDNGVRRKQIFEPRERLPCIFEHIYFGRPDSNQFGSQFSNAQIRREFGRQLYREHPIKADMVIPVPDSGVDAALGFSEESFKNSPIPLWFGLVRSHYIGRTFIAPLQADREAMIDRKFNVNKSVVNGKKVVVVDDSIVRGPTTRKITKVLKKGGASEVHLRISSPPYMYGCYLGIDTAEQEKLIAYALGSVEKIQADLGVDSLGYLSKEGMLSNPYLAKDGFCTFCFDGIEKIKRA